MSDGSHIVNRHWHSCTMHMITWTTPGGTHHWTRQGTREGGEWMGSEWEKRSGFWLSSFQCPLHFSLPQRADKRTNPEDQVIHKEPSFYSVEMCPLEGQGAGWERLSGWPHGHCWLLLLKHWRLALKLKCIFLLYSEPRKLSSCFSHLSPLGRKELDLR